MTLTTITCEDPHPSMLIALDNSAVGTDDVDVEEAFRTSNAVKKCSTDNNNNDRNGSEVKLTFH